MPDLPLVSVGLPVYNAQRYLRQALDYLLGQNYANLELIVSDNAVAGLIRTHVLARIISIAMRREWVQRLAFRTISQTGIRYPESTLSKSLEGLPKDAPRAGDRFPWLRLRFLANGPVEDLFQKLDDTRFNLIVFGQPSVSGDALGLGDLLRIHAIPADPANDAELTRAHIPQPSFYLLRPDGHVGLRGARLEAVAVARYVSESLHLEPKSGLRSHDRERAQAMAG